jgi:NitT/TauT family transport system substrate-binding protein
VKRIILAVVLSVLAVTNASLGQPEDTTVIRAAGSLNDSTTPLIYAERAHLFERAGLHVEIQHFTSGAAIATAVAGGALEIGAFNSFGLVQAHAKGLPFSLIAPGSVYRSEFPDGGLLVGANSLLRTPKDFDGKTLGALSLQDLSTFAVESWLDKNGGDSKTVHFVEVTPPLAMQAIESGRVDGASVVQPTFDAALATGHFRVASYSMSSIAPRFLVSAWYANADWIAKHRALVARFVGVMHEANVYVQSHPAETLPDLATLMGVDVGSIAKTHRAFQAEYLDVHDIQPVIEVAANYKAIPSPFPAAEMINPLALHPERTR